MGSHSKLVSMTVYNLGCIGPEGVTVQLDNILCLVGPNNAGKSTILRAYELAVLNGKLAEEDRSSRCPEGDCPAVEIRVHIPEGTQNIADRWIEKDGDLRLVMSRWEWREAGKAAKRKTYDPSIDDYAEDGKAGGLDAVFNARLPKPLRVGALEAPEKEQEKLLTLVLASIIEKVGAESEADTDLRKAIEQLSSVTRSSLEEFRADLATAADEVNAQFQQVFPNLAVRINVDLPQKPLDLGAALKKGSSVDVIDAGEEKSWSQQGTGTQRALFWSLLGVRSRLEAKQAKRPKAKKAGSADPPTGIALPGHMLLIDEPETGLHPSAIRAARRYLYELADDEGWQVILTTHSPLFIDPTADHTTIVRLDRDGGTLSPKTFQSETPDFSTDDKDKLKMLLKFDSSLAEMFFGGFPIVVEGDTEFAAFERVMDLDATKYPIEKRPVIIRARGKHTIVPILKILRQFKVPFAVLHDTDLPAPKDGGSNTAWQANYAIGAQVMAAYSQEGPRVRYRQSVPNFELAHGCKEVTKDKPWNIITTIESSPVVAASVASMLDDLLVPEGDDPKSKTNDLIVKQVKDWAERNSMVVNL